MQEYDATARMKTIKPDTTAPIYIPLSEYKDPENNSSLPPPPRHRVTPKLKPFEPEEILTQETFVNKEGDYQEQSEQMKKSNNTDMGPEEYRVIEPIARTVGDDVHGMADPSMQAMPSTVAAVLQAAENTQQPSLHTLAAAAMMPQSMHPSMSMYAGLPQIHPNGLPSQVSNGNTLPTASCFFGPQPTLPQPTSEADLHIQSQSQPQQQQQQPPPPQHQQQVMPHPSQQQHSQQRYSIPVKYENVHHAQPYLEKYEDNQNQHNFSQV